MSSNHDQSTAVATQKDNTVSNRSSSPSHTEGGKRPHHRRIGRGGRGGGRGGRGGRGGSNTHRRGRNSPRTYRSPVSPDFDKKTERFRTIPNDRNPHGLPSKNVVIGKNGSNAKRIHQETGCTIRILNDEEQRSWTRSLGLEVNTLEIRIVHVKIDPEVKFDEEFDQLNEACKSIASAVRHWRNIEFPPEEPKRQEPAPDDAHNSESEHSDGNSSE